jgi:hypothetical protein
MTYQDNLVTGPARISIPAFEGLPTDSQLFSQKTSIIQAEKWLVFTAAYPAADTSNLRCPRYQSITTAFGLSYSFTPEFRSVLLKNQLMPGWIFL